MKKINTLVLTIILVSFTLFSFTGCEDKKAQDPLLTVENTTKIFTENDKDQEEEIETEEANVTEKETITEGVTASQTITGDSFILSDIQQNKQKLTINDQKIMFHSIDRPIVIVNFFSTWCAPCRGEIPYLSDLQKKYKKKLFVVGILVNDKQDNNVLKEFTTKHHADYFISNGKQNDTFASRVVKELQLPENFSIPLTVIYKDGNYYTHYEGAVPVEMIDHDIQEAMKTKGL